MKNLSNQTILKLAFPLIFAVAFILFLVFLSPLLPPGIFGPLTGIFIIFFLIAIPFANQYQNPGILITGFVFIAILCGAVQYFYVKRLLRDQRWQYLLMIIVTYIQSGLLFAMLFIIHEIQLGGVPEM